MCHLSWTISSRAFSMKQLNAGLLHGRFVTIHGQRQAAEGIAFSPT
ncbi:hypothetical protein GCK32_016629 [Trichostrongylus colubriformis]|uniref:Uncharacterized protein n=1 Tax=Trichostrongylus colubriformis TaxID=6319 RepID=A0AAN8GB74_TRICO